MKQRKELIWLAVLVLVYAIVVLGTLAYGSEVLVLTPVVLLAAAFISGLFHPEMDGRFIAYIFIVFLAGFALSAVGAATGSIFGGYFYGNNLGVKLFDVPIIIGVYWLLLSYCSSVWISNLSKTVGSLNTSVGKALLASLVMVSVDVLMEQVAQAGDFWYWKNQLVPVQNYTAWFAFSFAFNYLFQRMEIDTRNPMAKWVLLLHVLFCIVINLSL